MLGLFVWGGGNDTFHNMRPRDDINQESRFDLHVIIQRGLDQAVITVQNSHVDFSNYHHNRILGTG